MDLKQYRSKLIGSKDERAVSPVIGVILMVAITVILAAVIAAFVLDMGSGVEQEAQAGVTIEIDNDDQEGTIEITSTGNADDFEVRGDTDSVSASNFDSAGDTLSIGTSASADVQLSGSGTVTVVGIIEDTDTETTVASEDFDF